MSEGHEAQPTVGIIDSPSVKSTESGGPYGYDAGKITKGRKRQIATDTQGNLLSLIVHTADIQEPDGGADAIARRWVVEGLGRIDCLKRVLADISRVTAYHTVNVARSGAVSDILKAMQRLLDRGAEQRGAGYFRAGKVLEVDGDLDWVDATVSGSGRGEYWASVEIERDRRGGVVDIIGSCTCPVGHNCKHVVAALLEAE